MARSAYSRSSRTEVVVRRESYFWPDQQLNAWIIVMLASGAVLTGLFAEFVVIQNQLILGIPWIMPFGITVGALTIVFIFIIVGLVFQRRLIPGVVILGSFILAVLYITGLIETGIQVFGSSSLGSISSNCQKYVTSQPSFDVSLNTLAWLEQNSICQEWYTLFAFWLVGTLFLLYMIVVAAMVARGGYGNGR